MRDWSAPQVPALDDAGIKPAVYSTSAQGEVQPVGEDGPARLYVCGITPYDATHLGHAATYVAFDLLVRAWRDAGVDVVYVQNTTDIDDPLLERAAATGVDWRELAESQIELFRTDMEALRVIPPQAFVGAVESIPQIAEGVEALLASGAAYTLPSGDVYYRVATPVEPPFGSESHYDAQEMARTFAERGGDPDTPGKEDPLDALLWRAARPDEPSWPGGGLGAGRPGWHIECALIARDHAGLPLSVQGGGSDLIFPHHEMGAAHAEALTGIPFAQAYVHTGMVGYEGEKMSKSKGNLVLVSKLRAAGEDPMAIRLALLAHHYRSDWMYDDAVLATAKQRLAAWRTAAARGSRTPAAQVSAAIRAALAADLDAPAALAAVDGWAAEAHPADAHAEGAGADAARVVRAVDALLGVDLAGS
ncbi:cysteine--1-D-myo-inosityl 2-amino-2-deoxy-alpha-D-glucopyranoside ligase [Brevibacterium sp. 5221]|uniref:L-cysteine:1D-myo-inositol 2-amino-2-deoxy-alpha-D-glucopyranoside ligase n=1 Tax=Brevibacterium rongguiense TaxID=2695267 RepID=A0A6N9H4U4_9MICO|nr:MULTISPECIES: cysteine--1-D-myo-inosityl 2-amino-2-deoxy-alpha-D-glucopyranoside ligase [Brevibacterium]MYM18939.1 cysteine--1-D-myo-inosityl 2-amino-2-deoxy-alpha-D-glucopyranoside ligase [Brevibacterium rongguiense]WAL40787.1 cysteine--1-D-myo-inosityl 2-amino-2-deoxy-alpha-D-glucopyranoside ligase [Brevibacterium sp. BRM-1]